MPMADVYGNTYVNCGTTGSTTTVWPTWNMQYTITQTTSTTTNAQVWPLWNQGFSQTGSQATTIVLTTGTSYAWPAWNAAYEETAEQKAARERQQAATQERIRQREQEAQAAKERALELLGYVLSAGQLASYREHGFFEVLSNKGRRWRIRDRGISGNVDLMPEIGEEREASYCAHPPGQLPAADHHLAQALVLATDEDAFLRVANCHYRRPAAA